MAKQKQTDKYGLGFDKGRQMLLDQRQKTSVCFCNHLKAAEQANYHELHGKYSLISLIMQDYSNGKGQKSFFVRFNISPRQLRVIHHWAETIYPSQMGKDHRTMELVKVYNDDYAKLELIHASKNKNPFAIKVTNGKADQNKKLVKGSDKTVMQWYSGDLFYSLWSELYDRLKEWELIHYSQLCKQFEPLTEKALAEEYASRNQQQYSNQPNAQRPVTQPRNQQQRNTAQQNQHNENNNGYAPHNDFTVPPPPPSTSNPEFEASFEETANYGSAYRR